MEDQRTTSRRSRPAVSLSVMAHIAVVAVVALWVTKAPRVIVAPPTQPPMMATLEIAGAPHSSRLRLPDVPSNGQSRTRPKLRQEEHKFPNPVAKVQPAKASGAAKQAAQQASDSAGTATAGPGSDAENATPTFPTFSPRPPVSDRALLPPSERQIVVDVNVSALGEVIGENLVKGMGNGLDKIVLDTVKTWHFHPATLNGNPVASEAELIFPFNPSYPIADS